jgi:uncharacterized membrane protein YecN with MAPEG domain
VLLSDTWSSTAESPDSRHTESDLGDLFFGNIRYLGVRTELVMPITALYAGILAPILILLSGRVIRQRREAKVAVGDGGSQMLLRRMRVQANFVEYVPFALLLMAFAESLQTWAWYMHLLGVVLLAGRASHAYGVSQLRENFTFRVFGMAATFSVIGAAAAACIFGALRLLL